ncbi:hypothetical protein [Lentzea albidocapillata]|uniref:Antirestriction protein (ArdA) n=1 Tax=Lentzea albidocapillata TaxID=40571 RepID=A0A1W2FK67_9PSEU|nr:hypothetical protein [Lentzea albidocapillata]SMD22321.1 hypothetical protein SAMN05660733_06751 [Lentzea albidocapillata]
MGASGWIRYAEYDPDPVVVLNALHAQELAGGEYHWAEPGVPRPASVQELQELYGVHECLPLECTHSVLDIFDIHYGAADVAWAMRPLDEATIQEKFGTLTPTREQFDAVYEADELFCERASGCFTTLYVDGVPATTAVWGVTGD